MSTQRQIKANRKNAQKSTGPKTPEGKAKSAQNATTHGLTAAHDVIKGESQEEFDAHKQGFLDALKPKDAVEDFLADRVASLAWRLKRAGSIERQMLDGFAADLEYLRQHRSPWDYPASSEDPDLTLGCAVRRDLDNDKTLDRLKLYERRIESSFFKSLHTLEKRQRKQPAGPERGVESRQGLTKCANSPKDSSHNPAVDLPIHTSTGPVAEILQNKAKMPWPESIVRPGAINTCENDGGPDKDEGKAQRDRRADGELGVPVQKAVPMRPLTH